MKTAEVLSFHKNEVITVFHTLEEDMKHIIPAFIYISPAYYQAMHSLMCTTYSNSKSDEGQRLRSKDSTIYRQVVGILRRYSRIAFQKGDDYEQSCVKYRLMLNQKNVVQG